MVYVSSFKLRFSEKKLYGTNVGIKNNKNNLFVKKNKEKCKN